VKPTSEPLRPKPLEETTISADEPKISGENRLPDDIARLGISTAFPKSQRRARRPFTTEEDEAILRGFEKYGAQWQKIKSDPDLQLDSRGRTDLRDRFRNKYPDKFVEAGHKFKQPKEQKEDTSESSNKPAEEVTSRWGDHERDSNINSILDPPLPAPPEDRAQHSLKLLMASIADPYFNDMERLSPDEGDPQMITLSRNIFTWADKQARDVAAMPKTTGHQQTEQSHTKSSADQFNMGLAMPKTTEHQQTEQSHTITSADQFNINPMLALKGPPRSWQPTSSSLAPAIWQTYNMTTALSSIQNGPSNPQSAPKSLHLSGILNDTVSLPPPSELVAGVQARSDD
jgi:hypothetical protein